MDRETRHIRWAVACSLSVAVGSACVDRSAALLPEPTPDTEVLGRILVHWPANSSAPTGYRVLSPGDGSATRDTPLSLGVGDAIYVFDYSCRIPDELPPTGSLATRSTDTLGLPMADRIQTARWDGRSLSPWETHWTKGSHWPPEVLEEADVNLGLPLCDSALRTLTIPENRGEVGFALALPPDCESMAEELTKESCEQRLLLALAPNYEDKCGILNGSPWQFGFLYEVTIPDDPSKELRSERVMIRPTASPSTPTTNFEYHAGAVYAGRKGADEKVLVVSRTGQRATLTMTKGDDGKSEYSLNEHAPPGGECEGRAFLAASPSGKTVARLTRKFTENSSTSSTSFSWISVDSWTSTTSFRQFGSDTSNVKTDDRAGLHIAWPDEGPAYVAGVGNELRTFVPPSQEGGPPLLGLVDGLSVHLGQSLTVAAVTTDPGLGPLVATACRDPGICALEGALLRAPEEGGQPWWLRMAQLGRSAAVVDIAVGGRWVLVGAYSDNNGKIGSFPVFDSLRTDPRTGQYRQLCPNATVLPNGELKRMLTVGPGVVRIVRRDDDWYVEVIDRVATPVPPGTCELF